MHTPIYTLPEYGKLLQISSLIARVTANNAGPYTFTGTGTYIVGTSDLAVIDPGPADEAHKQALIAAIAGRPVLGVLVTHTHADHSTLAPWLAAQCATKTYGYGPHGGGKKAGLEDEKVEAGADMDFSPDIFLKDGDVISGSGWTIRSVFTPGHTSNHMCFELAEENALFTGDHVMRWATTVISPPDGDMRDYMDSLKKVRDKNYDIMYPTHDKPVTKPTRFTSALIGHRRQREQQIFDALSAGHITISAITERLYKDVDPRLHLAASRSVFSHLIMMVEDGRVTCNQPIRLDSKFMPLK